MYREKNCGWKIHFNVILPLSDRREIDCLIKRGHSGKNQMREFPSQRNLEEL